MERKTIWMIICLSALAGCNGVAPPMGGADASVDTVASLDTVDTADAAGQDLTGAANHACNLIDNESFAAKGTCYQSVQPEAIQELCEAFGGTVKQGNCPTATAVGKCSYDVGDPHESHIYFYPNYFVSDMQTACENDQGQWTKF